MAFSICKLAGFLHVLGSPAAASSLRMSGQTTEARDLAGKSIDAIHPVSSFNAWSNSNTSVFDGKLLLLHVGKTGGTTLNMMLKGALDTSHTEILDHKSSHVVMRECHKHPDQRYVFFVRSPLHRFTSAWISRFTEGRPSFYKPWSYYEHWVFRHFQTPDRLACALASKDPVERFNATWAMQHIVHARQDLRYYVNGLDNLRACQSQIAFVGRTEHYVSDFGSMVEMFRERRVLLKEPADLETNLKARHSSPEGYDRYKKLGRCAVDALRDWYSEDYQIIRFLSENRYLNSSYSSEVEYLDSIPMAGTEKHY